MVEHGERSTIAKVSVYNEGLANLSMLMVRSGHIGNYVE